MEWKDMPTEEGWYWVDYNRPGETEGKLSVVRCFIENFGDGDLWYSWDGDCSDELTPGYPHLWGPLPEPRKYYGRT